MAKSLRGACNDRNANHDGICYLSVGWEAEARRWIQWARTPGHDSYWRFHRDQFLRLLPPPGRQTLDIGCGEGRLARDLKELGHRIVGIDSSPSLVAAAREFDPSMDVRLADAAALPLDDACADLAVAFMSLQDIDGMPAAIQEAARVLEPGGRFCLAIVHPINSAGSFEGATADGPFGEVFVPAACRGDAEPDRADHGHHEDRDGDLGVSRHRCPPAHRP